MVCVGIKPFHQRLACDRQAPSKARKLLADWMCDPHQGCLDDALLLVSEVVTNAVVHAGPPLAVDFDFAANDALHIAVHDGTHQLAGPPIPVEELLPEPEDLEFVPEHGRGLPLLDQLAEEWALEPDDSGKTVTFFVTCRAR